LVFLFGNTGIKGVSSKVLSGKSAGYDMETLESTQAQIKQVTQEILESRQKLSRLKQQVNQLEVEPVLKRVETSPSTNESILHECRLEVERFLQVYIRPLCDELRSGTGTSFENFDPGFHVEVSIGRLVISMETQRGYKFEDLKSDVFKRCEISTLYLDMVVFTDFNGNIFLLNADVGLTLEEYPTMERRVFLYYSPVASWKDLLGLDPIETVTQVDRLIAVFQYLRNEEVRKASHRLLMENRIESQVVEEFEEADAFTLDIDDDLDKKNAESENQEEILERTIWDQVYHEYKKIGMKKELSVQKKAQDTIFFVPLDLSIVAPSYICLFIVLVVYFALGSSVSTLTPYAFNNQQELSWIRNYRGGAPSSDAFLNDMLRSSPIAFEYISCESACFLNGVHQIISHVRVRQYRSLGQTCRNSVITEGDYCFDKYSESTQMTYDISKTTPVSLKEGNPFQWTEGSEDFSNFTNTNPFLTLPYTRYNAAGYYAVPSGDFGPTQMFDAEFIGNNLFDNFTRAVFIEFSTLCFNSGETIQHMFVFTKDPAGGYELEYLPVRIPLGVFTNNRSLYNFSVMLIIMGIITILYLIGSNVVMLRKLRGSGYRWSPWFVFDVIMIALLIAVITTIIVLTLPDSNFAVVRDAAASMSFVNYMSTIVFISSSRVSVCVVFILCSIRLSVLFQLPISGHQMFLNLHPLRPFILMWMFGIYLFCVISALILISSNLYLFLSFNGIVEYLPKMLLGFFLTRGLATTRAVQLEDTWSNVVVVILYLVLQWFAGTILLVAYCYMFSPKNSKRLPFDTVSNPIKRMQFYMDAFAPASLVSKKVLTNRHDSSMILAELERDVKR